MHPACRPMTAAFLLVFAGYAAAQNSGCGGLEGDDLVKCQREAPKTKSRAADAPRESERAPFVPPSLYEIQAQERKRNDERKRIAALPYMPTVGMTLAQAKETEFMRSHCFESGVRRTTTATRQHEQWSCNDTTYLYFDNGILTAIQD